MMRHVIIGITTVVALTGANLALEAQSQQTQASYRTCDDMIMQQVMNKLAGLPPGTSPVQTASELGQALDNQPSTGQCVSRSGGFVNVNGVTLSDETFRKLMGLKPIEQILPPSLGGVTAPANKSATSKGAPAPPFFTTPLGLTTLIGGGALVTLPFVTASGSDSGGTSSGGGTVPPPTTVAPPASNTTNICGGVGSDLSPCSGSFVGDANLGPQALIITATVKPEQCAGSSASYGETIVVSVNASGVGSIAMQDAPTFPRTYTGTLTAAGVFSASGTFPFFGSPIPGKLTVTWTDPKHVNFTETTTYGSCSNTYAGPLTKQ